MILNSFDWYSHSLLRSSCEYQSKLIQYHTKVCNILYILHLTDTLWIRSWSTKVQRVLGILSYFRVFHLILVSSRFRVLISEYRVVKSYFPILGFWNILGLFLSLLSLCWFWFTRLPVQCQNIELSLSLFS